MKSFFKKPYRLGILMLVSTSLMACSALNYSSFTELVPSFSPAPSPSPLDAATLLVLENKIYQQVNRYRLSRNLSPLLLNRAISQQARLHSQRMAAGLVPFSHQDFDKRAQTIGVSVPYQAVGENLAVNQGYDDPVMMAVDGWIKSQGHRENMEGDFDSTGIGVATDNQGKLYFTQIFLKRQSAPVSTNSLSYDPIGNQSFLITLEENTNYQVNRYRISQNLPPLRLDARISHEARLFSQKMA
ncbi:CAP domain-containing protein, partial [Microcystis sp.]|uniref:CAP domain-containing protein n=1 Tax=Microcystis sp. TaxID=1127 RepID=UPI00391A9358